MNLLDKIPSVVYFNPDYNCFFDSDHNMMSDEFDEIWLCKAAEFPVVTFEEDYSIGELIQEINDKNYPELLV